MLVMLINNVKKDLLFLNNFNKKTTLLLIPNHFDYNFNNKGNLKELHTTLNNINIDNIQDIISSSLNAIIALLISLGYTTNEILLKVNDINLYHYSNNHQAPLSITIDHNNNLKNSSDKQTFTFLNQDQCFLWVQRQIALKLHNPLATFNDLKKQTQTNLTFKNIHLIGLNLTTNKLVILNYQDTPNLPIAIAVRICMSIFTMLSVVTIKNLFSNKTSTYTDGGIVLQHVLH